MNNQSVTLKSQKLDSRYNEGYFHGSGSGYGKQGYQNEYADWSALIEWIKAKLSYSPRWLDIGCAYGYLVEQARILDIEAYGVDISSFALRQEDGVRDYLIQGMADAAPFVEDAFDVISIFDIIEHVENPGAVLDQVEKVLKFEGFCFLSTPDPLKFSREEPTHIHERPPSFWVRLFQQRGWYVALRFGGSEYEFELMATRNPGADWEELKQDYQKLNCQLVDCIETSGEHVEIAPRVSSAAAAVSGETSLYILNSSDGPQSFNFSLTTKDEQHPDLFVGDLKLRYQDAEQQEGLFFNKWSAIPLAPGGHNLSIRVAGEPITIDKIIIDAAPYDRDRFLEELPFDHYQRYQIVSSLLNQFNVESLSVLDVGGVLGYLQLFTPQHQVTVLDRTWEDTAQSVQYDADHAPFDDLSFDVVIAVDTLEHVPQEEREKFVSELSRLAKRSIIICGPFDEPEVAETEAALRDYLTGKLNRSDRFLDEHAQYGLPNCNETLNQIEQQGFQIAEFPNGYLPRWLAMQMASFALSGSPELAEGSRQLNSLYNRYYFAHDNRNPSYRILAAAFREEIPERIRIEGRHKEYEDPSAMWPVASLISSLSMSSVLQEKDSLLVNQGQRLASFLEHLKNLEKDIIERDRHAANLDELLKKQTLRLDDLQKHGDNLETLLKEQKHERKNLQELLKTTQYQNKDLVTHGSNLEQREKELHDMIASLQKHTDNLENMLSENQKHTRNLEKLYKTQEKSFLNVISELGLDTVNSISDGLPHLESRVKNLVDDNQVLTDDNQVLSDDNQKLYDDLETIASTRVYRLMRKLGWSPFKKQKESTEE